MIFFVAPNWVTFGAPMVHCKCNVWGRLVHVMHLKSSLTFSLPFFPLSLPFSVPPSPSLSLFPLPKLITLFLETSPLPSLPTFLPPSLIQPFLHPSLPPYYPFSLLLPSSCSSSLLLKNAVKLWAVYHRFGVLK